jgi:hypothetical protein
LPTLRVCQPLADFGSLYLLMQGVVAIVTMKALKGLWGYLANRASDGHCCRWNDGW